MSNKLTIPTLDKITLEQYQKFLKLDLDKNNDIFIMQKMIEIFCNKDLSFVMDIKYNSLVEVTGHLNSLFVEKPKHKQTFTMGGIEYGFLHLEDITMGEYVDLDSCISEPSDMHKAFAVLYRPIKGKYKDNYSLKKYNPARGFIMKKMPLSVVLGSIGFFLTLNQELLNNLQLYLIKQTAQLTPQQKQDFLKNGDITHQSITALAKACSTLTRWNSSAFLNV